MDKHLSEKENFTSFENQELLESNKDDLVRSIQAKILQRSAHIPGDGRITLQFVRDFEWASNWAENLVSYLEYDSVYHTSPGIELSLSSSPDLIQNLYKQENSLRTASSSQSLSISERARIVERLRHYKLETVDEAALDALFEASNFVIMEAITEENCLRELATAEDSVQRAELFMLMGNDVEAYREFKKITGEERSNPENALALVDLIERYDSTREALKVLKRWFLLEIVLHPLPFDLVYDLIPDGKTLQPAPRLRYLQSILLHSHEMDLKTIQEQLVLVMPQELSSRPELPDVNKRLRQFGLTMKRLDLILDESAAVNLFTMMSNISDQLIHAAELARNMNKNKFAIKALERAVLANFVLVNLRDEMPDNAMDELMFEVHRSGQVVQETLEDIEELLEDILIFLDSDSQHNLLTHEIAALRRYIKRLNTETTVEKADGMSGLS